MNLIVIQEIIDADMNVLGYLHRSHESKIVPPVDTSIQFKDGYVCNPVHSSYDLDTDTMYSIDMIQIMYLEQEEFREFLDEFRGAGWRFIQDIYSSEKGMYISC